MALSYEEQIRIEMEKIKELKRKQKIEQSKIYAELGRMLSERFPDITPETFDEFIAANTKMGNDEYTAPQGEKQGLMAP